MNSFPRSVAVVIFLAILPVGAQANTYKGIITQIVTASSNPSYEVGMVVECWYSYQSDTRDGLFQGLDFLGLNSDEPRSLYGELFGFFGNIDPHGKLKLGDSGGRERTKLMVQYGQVTSFNMDGQTSGSDYNFYFDHFSCRQELQGFLVKGSLSFGEPTPVPEGLSTFYALGVGLALIGAWRWIRVKLVAATVQRY